MTTIYELIPFRFQIDKALCGKILQRPFVLHCHFPFLRKQFSKYISSMSHCYISLVVLQCTTLLCLSADYNLRKSNSLHLSSILSNDDPMVLYLPLTLFQNDNEKRAPSFSISQGSIPFIKLVFQVRQSRKTGLFVNLPSCPGGRTLILDLTG